MKKIEEMELFEAFFLIAIKKVYQKNNYDVPYVYKENDIYNRINDFYSLKFGKRLDITIETEKTKLYEYAKDKSRYIILNDLIKTTIQRLIYKEQLYGQTIDNTDLFVANNLKSLIHIMMEQGKFAVLNTNLNQSVELSKLSKNEVDNYVCGILSEIDPTLEWLEIYNNAKQNKRIIYLNELTEKEKKAFAQKLGIENIPYKNAVITGPDGPYILLTYTNTTKDFTATIHEFAHYITEIKNPNSKSPKTLAEFSSIFYESYALSFLIRKGISEEEISTINSDRLTNTFDLIADSAIILQYIEMFCDNLEISEELDIKRHEAGIIDFKKTLDEDLLKTLKLINPTFFNPKPYANNCCDKCIEQLILNTFDIYLYYPYIIGNYLAVKSIENLSFDKDILLKIKDYTERATSIDPYDVFKGIGCDVEALNLTRAITPDDHNVRKLKY